MAINQKHEKEIIALDIFEAVRLRPGMYLGQVALMDDKIPIIENGKLIQKEKKWSPGFMHLIVEILENSLDEAKRMKGKMKTITVEIDTKHNLISIRDSGNGFHKAGYKHPKTKKNVVRTAYEELHAGSNFTENQKNLLGTHGVGASVVNILSKKFGVTTINKTHIVKIEWEDFKVVKETREKIENQPLGTRVTFIPSPQVFWGYKWNVELIQTYLSFKQFLIKNDPGINKLKLEAEVDGKKLELFDDFLPENHIRVDSKERGSVILWPKYQDSMSVGFINGSLATGIHQRIVNDWLNEFFDYKFAHHFFDTLVSLNLPSNLMEFADQNKSKFSTARLEVEPLMTANFKTNLLKRTKGTDIAAEILKKIEERTYAENIKKIKKAQRTSKRVISEKYTAASKTKNSIYVAEGMSAAGGVKQSRNSETEGVYALKGKIKNTRSLSDLTDNKEILEIMSILGIEPGSKKPPTYKNIIIAADEDPDGQHIAALIVNFFFKWFPYIIQEGRLKRLVTPLVAADHGYNGRKYFYTMDDFTRYKNKYKLSNIAYLKGLGSLSLDDWDYVMNNKVFFEIEEDGDAEKYLDIAFGVSSQKRKTWLEGK